MLLASKVFAFIVGISASLIALLKAYDSYYIRYTQFANYNKLSDANLKKQIAKLEKERCWWPTGRPPCKLIELEYDRAISVQNLRKKAMKSYKDMASDKKFKNGIQVGEDGKLETTVGIELQNNVAFLKAMVATAHEKSIYKATNEDIRKLSQDFNNYQKIWQIKIEFPLPTKRGRIKMVKQLMNAGLGSNNKKYDVLEGYSDNYDKTRALGEAFIKCTELHINTVQSWVAVVQELDDRIQELDDGDDLKANWNLKWKMTPRGGAEKLGIGKNIQLLKPKSDMTPLQMMNTSWSTIEKSLKLLNKDFVGKLPLEMKKNFKNFTANSQKFDCYRINIMMASLRLLGAAVEIFRDLSNNPTEELLDEYEKYTKAHLLLRKSTVTKGGIEAICALENIMEMEDIYELAEYIVGNMEEEENWKRLKLQDYKQLPTGETKEDSEVLSSEEKEKEEDGPAVGEITVGKTKAGKIFKGKVTYIHQNKDNKGKVTIQFENKKGIIETVKWVTPLRLVKDRVIKRLGGKGVKTRKGKKSSAKKRSNRVDNILTI